MTGRWLPRVMVEAASLLALSSQRAEWRREWRSELWYIPQDEAAAFSLGAFRDALWLRRNHPPTGTHLESPLRCLAYLTAAALASIVVTVLLSVFLKRSPLYAQMAAADLARGCVATLGFSCLLSPAALIGWTPANRPRMPWSHRLRRGLFLSAKILLVQPVLVCLFVIWILIPVGPFTCALCILVLRWVITDQRRRCPVCLRMLSHPVRIGSASQTFLEWYGAESICDRGHGLLQTSGAADTYSTKSRWLRLDSSWSSLF